jgi:hypothetical protein
VVGTPRPPLRVVAPLIAGVLVLCVLGIRSYERRKDVERRAAAVASTIAGHSVKVHCPGVLKRHLSFTVDEGHVKFSAAGVPYPETTLSGDVCAGLRRVIDDGSSLNLQCLYWQCSKGVTDAAMALIVLTHESVHMRGVMDEGQTECEAQDRVAATARAFGLDPASAQAEDHWARTDYAELLPDEYRTCAA